MPTKTQSHSNFAEAKKWLENNDVKIFVTLIVSLTLFGLIMVFSSSSIMSMLQNNGDYSYVFVRQLTIALIGFTMMAVMYKISALFWWRMSEALLAVSLFLQFLVVATPLGVSYGGNTNWLQVGAFTVQPSEFIKLALIIWIAKHVELNYGRVEVTPKKFFPPVVFVSLLSIGLVLAGSDLGTTSIIVLIIIGTLYFSGVKMRYLAAAATFTLFAAILYAFSGRADRIAVWLNGCSMELYETTCWQIIHGQWALAEGGVFGLGLGSSKAKWSWLPHAESDFIYAIIGEELGMFGALFVAAFFLLMMMIMIRIARHQNTIFGRVVMSGIMVWIIFQAYVNIAVVLQILPVLGVPLPFISAGGSSLLANLIAVGIVLSMHNYNSKHSEEIFEETIEEEKPELYFWKNNHHS